MDFSALRRSGHAPSLVAALLHFDVSFMAWVLLGALGAYIGEDLGLSASAKGLMVAVPLLSAARSSASRSACSATATGRRRSA